MKILRPFFLFLILGCFSASAYDLNYDTNGNPRRWNFTNINVNVATNVFNRTTKAVRYYIGSNGWSLTNTAAELNAVRNSFGTWQSIPNTVIKFEEAGLAPSNSDVNSSDGSNIVFWATNVLVGGGLDNISGALAVTFSTSFISDNTIAQWDIAINGVQHGWFTDFTQTSNTNNFVEGTLSHEIGHSLGLEHSAMGGATMLYSGTSGVDAQAGLSVDEVAFAHALYPASNVTATLSTLRGTVTKGGLPVLGAAVIIESTNGNLAGATVTRSNGTYSMGGLLPGGYNVRVVPLDPSSANYWLIQGVDIGPEFSGADTSFLATGNFPITMLINTTNNQNYTVTNGTQPFRIDIIRLPSSDPNSFQFISLPGSMSPGQSNYTVGIFSPDLPTNGPANTLTITGDGLTVGPSQFEPSGTILSGLNGIAVSISVASNATPGLRSFVVQSGTNIAYANGYLEILPLVPDYNFDGLDDVFQRKYFFPFTATNAAPTADPDHDGFNNLAEYLSGSDPTNPASFLKMLSVQTTRTNSTVTWASGAGRHYQVISRTNLLTGSWTNTGPVVTASGPTAQLVTGDTNATVYYRVIAVP